MPPTPQDEHEIIRAAARGDRAAFDRLVQAKRGGVVRTAYQITGSLEDAQDVAQTVLLKLWHGLSRFDAARRFDTWLYRVTVNASIDVLRSRGPRAALHSLAATEEPADTTGPGADQRIDGDRLQRAFLRLAAGLAPRQRAAFVLREIEGLETREIADILGVTESTVRNHLLQARRTLREGLEREYPDLVPRSAPLADDEEERA